MKLLNILLVEDDDVDAEHVVRGFRRQGFEWPITIARNGLEALDVLRNTCEPQNLWHPRIIITDINMPLMNGLELLRELRHDPDLRRSVVFVLSSSNLESDRSAAYAQRAAGYLLKQDLDQNWPQLSRLLACYGSIVEFPPEYRKQ